MTLNPYSPKVDRLLRQIDLLERQIQDQKLLTNLTPRQRQSRDDRVKALRRKLSEASAKLPD